jgi:pilus assembly protein Flp/PilA
MQPNWIHARGNEKAPLGPRTTLFLAPPRHYLLEDFVMKNLLRHARHLLVNEDGPTAVEYAVMLALIIVVCLTAITAIGTNANATFQSVADKLPAGAAS